MKCVRAEILKNWIIFKWSSKLELCYHSKQSSLKVKHNYTGTQVNFLFHYYEARQQEVKLAPFLMLWSGIN